MDEIERLRAEARDKEVLPGNIVERLERTDLLDFAFRTRIRGEQDRWVPVLSAAVEDEQLSSRALMNAGLFLLECGESKGTDALVRALDGEDSRFLIGMLAGLSARRSGPWKLPLDTTRFAPVLLSSLDDPSSHLGRLALDVAGSYKVSQVYPRLREFLQHSDVGVRAKSCSWLLLAGEHTGDVLNCAEQLLTDERFVGGTSGWPAQNLIQQGLALVAEGSDTTARSRVLDLLEQFVRSNLGSQENSVANSLWQAIETVVKQRKAAAVPLLETVYGSDTLSWVRGAALRHLAELQGPENLSKVIESLRSDSLRADAAKALEILARRHGVQGQVGRLREAAKGANQQVLRKIASALMAAADPEAEDALRSLAKELDPVTSMAVHWHLNRIGPRDVITRLVSANVVPELPESTVEELAAKWKGAQGAYAFLMEVFHSVGSMLFFDVETTRIPVEHDRLVRDFAEASRGVFRVEAVVETWNRKDRNDLSGDYDVQFVHDGKLHKFKARNFGDWYDVRAVVRAVNRALADAGRSERFFDIHSGDQMALYFFADAESFEAVRDELRMPVEPPDARK